jgi:DNA replication protein DnaC
MAVNNSQYDEIMREYERQRRANRDLDEKCRQEVYTAIPSLKEIDDEISKTSLDAFSKSLDGDDSALEKAKENINNLVEKKYKLIEAKGFDQSFLDPHYNCRDCQDTGYIDNKPCHCLKQRILDITFSQSELEENVRDCKFDDFSLDYYSETKVDPASNKSERLGAFEALKASKQFVSDFKKGITPSSLLFFGDTGTGKTFLSNCIANELLCNGISVIYFSATKLFDSLREQKFSDSHSKEYDKIFNSDVLIIDDLGTEGKTTDFIQSQLFFVINERLLRNRPMIISTNLNVLDLKTLYSERITSRIYSNFYLLKFCGDDIRIRKKIK